MTDRIYQMAIHHLEKVDDTYKVTQGSGNIEINPTTKRVVDEMHKVYARRPSKSYGKFVLNDPNYPTPTAIQQFLSGSTDFEQLTIRLMDTLKSQAQSRPASEGGHVFFAHFMRDAVDYLLVSIVTDKLSAALKTKSTLEDVTHLDIDGYRFAGRINITSWQKGEDRYLGFLKGKGQVSEYFKQFLGCDTTVQRRIETANFVAALEDFWKETGITADKRAELSAKAADICGRYARNEEEIDFSAFANELTPDDPTPLVEHLANPDFTLSDGFVPDRRALRGLIAFKGKTQDWAIEFDRRALQAGRIRYDSTANTLTLSGVPDDLAADLRHELDVT